MDNLRVYLILIFGYVGYSLVKSARKQREGDGEESEEERFFSEEQDLRRNLNDVLKSRPGTIPASVYDRGAATGVSRGKGLKKVPGGFSRPFLSTELEGAAKPAIAARESFLRKVEGEMPEVASMRRIDDAIGDLPEKECENTPAFSSAVGMGKSRPFTSTEELRRAVIASEILNRKY